MAAPDRLELLGSQNTLTGIDFVYVHPDQVTLDVFFLVPPASLVKPLPGTLPREHVRIYSTEELDVPVANVTWAVADGRDVFRLTTARPGGFARYRLRLDDARIDPYFNDVDFSFKANCPSDLDCKPRPHECPPEEAVDFPVDYRARDFWSLRRALLDFASQRYPDWKDRLEADVGVMLAELMSGLGDEHAYIQDRIAREASLETASERRSLRRHARLVDYDIHDGRGARGWLDVTVKPPDGGPLPPPLAAGAYVYSERDDGTRIDFEVGGGLADALAGRTWEVRHVRNTFTPHIWDERDTCLPVGETRLWLKGAHKADLPFDDLPAGRPPGKWMLLATEPADPSLPARRHLVRVIDIQDEVDPLPVGAPVQLTRLTWEPEQALPFELDLEALSVRGNLVPVTAGRTFHTVFSIGPQRPDVPPAVERAGPNGSIAYLFSLPDPAEQGLVWLGEDPRNARPELRVVEVTPLGPGWVEGEEWTWWRSFVGMRSATRTDRAVTLDDGVYRRVVGYQRPTGDVVHVDYVGGPGFTLRFGDGEFGLEPTEKTFFRATFRLGNGTRGNVPAGAIRFIDAAEPLAAFLEAVDNPLPLEDGLEPEEPVDVRKLAPEAFRAVTHRAVRPEDYAEAAERLPWVQRAGASFRWTGSWLSAFVTPDPLNEPSLSPSRRRELVRQVDRFRQAGREVHVRAPRYVDLDLEITVCVEPSAYPGDVKERVRVALLGRGGVRPVEGFFDEDHFTFGTPLDRSELEAAIQRVPGVRAVESMSIRRRGWFDWRLFEELVYPVALDEVIRVEGDPLHPDRGSLRLVLEGGA
jgi:hypothetical protein